MATTLQQAEDSQLQKSLVWKIYNNYSTIK
jgi:hypothetical protein